MYKQKLETDNNVKKKSIKFRLDFFCGHEPAPYSVSIAMKKMMSGENKNTNNRYNVSRQ